MAKTKAGRAGQRHKSIEEVVAFALSHRIRVQILTVLSEGTYSPHEIAQRLDEPLNKVSHHIRELLDGGSIELARVAKVRNAEQHFYRAVETPFYSDEEVWAMTPYQRQVSAGLVLQNMIAEAMSAFWAGKIRDDRRTWLAWRWFNVDEQGRHEIADEQQRFWSRIKEIEVDATNRRADSGERARSVIVAEMGFERERAVVSPPDLADANAEQDADLD